MTHRRIGQTLKKLRSFCLSILCLCGLSIRFFKFVNTQPIITVYYNLKEFLYNFKTFLILIIILILSILIDITSLSELFNILGFVIYDEAFIEFLKSKKSEIEFFLVENKNFINSAKVVDEAIKVCRRQNYLLEEFFLKWHIL